MLRDLETGEERWLAYPVQHDDQESRATLDVLPGMSFTPDSRHLVASYGGRIWRLPVEGGDAQEIPFTVSFDLGLGPDVFFDYPVSDDPTFTVRQIRDAVPSPDGERLAFTALDRLYVSDADGGDARRIGPDDASVHFPTWSPDGNWIAFATWEDDSGHLWRVRPGGGGLERLTTQGGLYITPAWSPDGRRIVALRGWARDYRTSTSPFGVGAAEEIVWVPADGGDATLVAPSEDRADPHFRADEPDRIYFYQGGDTDALVSLRWDGTDPKKHLEVTGPTPAGADEPMDPDFLKIAPRGDQALVGINGQLYAVTVPLVGKTPRISVADPERAAFPAVRLTDPMGGEFPAWEADGRTVHWSLGNAHFVYDLDAAEAFADSVEAAEAAEPAEEPAEEEPAEEEEPLGEPADEEDEEEEPSYEPTEIRIRIMADRDIPAGVVALTGGRVITMNGDEILDDGVVVVRDNRIEAVGPAGAVTVPDGAREIDVSGHTIVPGFVDTHAHMWPAWYVHRKDQWIYAAN
nr:amidohydrolase [Gemmatimonadota bacterium]NIQ53227.1 amidohydrolase [Gemmatimonadota bacterium]NIU73373.1 amidohydrolase [Gammaproteobacteria bacterium]NIX43603.1 amidohydrolase [Gemmatimonadota bacterium]NIY07792.1 amidohydrolase [Gemmatimonadota bacterium]